MEGPHSIDSLASVIVVPTSHLVRVGDWQSPDYRRVIDTLIVKNELVFAAETLDGKKIVSVGGRESEPYDELLQIGPEKLRLLNLNGNLCYVAKKGSEDHFVLGDMEGHATQVRYLFEFNGPGCIIELYPHSFLGTSLLKHSFSEKYYQQIYSRFYSIDNKLAFQAERFGGTPILVWNEGEYPCTWAAHFANRKGYDIKEIPTLWVSHEYETPLTVEAKHRQAA